VHEASLTFVSQGNGPTRVSLVATYELGRQPFGIASPAAWLKEAGVEVITNDLSRQELRPEVLNSDLIAFHLPMHTATRLALPVIRRVRALAPRARLCAYGLYAGLNAAVLRDLGVEYVLGGEFEGELVKLACGHGGRKTASSAEGIQPRLRFRVPDRTGLPGLEKYASLQMPCGDRRVVGYTEASRGCKHRCRHCPIVPIYDGQFRVVPREVVIADIRSQVEAGAQHITFGDPDFFNGIGHAINLVREVNEEFPELTYDVTIKVEHLRRYEDKLNILRDTGCVFVVSAVESIDDDVLMKLEKGHTEADFEQVVSLCREIGLTLSPTFIPFTPWTTLRDYFELLQTIDRLELVEQVSPVQLTLRLLIPERSQLLDLIANDFGAWLSPFDRERLVYPWRHLDARVDRLQEGVTELVGKQLNIARTQMFEQIWKLAACELGEFGQPRTPVTPSRATVAYLNEPWYC